MSIQDGNIDGYDAQCGIICKTFRANPLASIAEVPIPHPVLCWFRMMVMMRYSMPYAFVSTSTSLCLPSALRRLEAVASALSGVSNIAFLLPP
jgi:hypothetical protein